MKNLFNLSILFSLVVLFSCQKEEPTEYEIRKGNIVGDWIVMPEVLLGIDDTFSITFNADGTGTRTFPSLTEQIDFEWVYQFNPEKVLIIESTEMFNIVRSSGYSIITNTSTEQNWNVDHVDSNGTNPSLMSNWQLRRP